MNNLNSTFSQGAGLPSGPQGSGFSPWQRLKSKRISYLTLPLLVMATVTEFVILATGWKYQKVVCVPQGMGVTFFGIGPIGATILAVELLKLPLAIWTASRRGWQKALMVVFGLPLICLLTFQLVKDMAVYEMGVALTPASQFLDKATAEDDKSAQLSSELAEIEGMKAEREHKLAELAANEAKAKADLEDSLKRNDEARNDAISLTDYQRTQLAEVDTRESAIIAQFNSDTAEINKSLADLRARRDTEVARDSKWNAEEARIENEYKAKLADYTNRKTEYDKEKAEYDNANFLKRQLMKEPVDPGVPPVRESNTVLKSSLLADLDAEIKAKEAELVTVDTKHRDRIAQVEADASQLRDEFDHRSGTKREEADHQRDALIASEASLEADFKAQQKQIDAELAAAVQKVDGIRADLDASRKRAEGFYEAREASIRTTQVHRIATTVEIIRAMIKGERPMSIKMTAKERGDILTDQISMVRIWVYPVLAFIVAFLPTLMVEIGFSTVFEAEEQRPLHRLGFLGRHLHTLYVRAGRQKILRAERTARELSSRLAAREQALAVANTALASHKAQLQQKESEWEIKFADLNDSFNQALSEKDALRDFQQVEIERQVQSRQGTWNDRLTQLRQELDAQHAAHEAERAAMAQEHHQKLLEVSEDCRAQVLQTRRQLADAEVAADEKATKLAHELKEAVNARDAACAQLQQQEETASLKLTQVREESARELEKAARQEKIRLERQQSEFAKTLQQRNEELEHLLKRREQELSLEFDTRLAQEQARFEQETHRREEGFERQVDARVREVEARWNQELQSREDAAQIRLKQREQQLQAQSEARLNEFQKQAAQELSRRETELERQLEAQSREAAARLKQELQQKETAFEAKVKQREQEMAIKAEAREAELQTQRAADLSAREEEMERQATSRIRAVETRLGIEAQQREEIFVSKSRQRDQQWQLKMDALRNELQSQNDEVLRRREGEAENRLRELEGRLREEMRQKEEAAQSRAKQREQEFANQLNMQAEARLLAAHTQWEAESEVRMRMAVEPFRTMLSRAENERDEARQTAADSTRQVQNLEKKLTEASTFLSAWRNGKSTVGAAG